VAEFVAIDEEVTEEPKPGTHLFDAAGIEWRRTMGCERWHQVRKAGFCEYWLNLRTQHGPLTPIRPSDEQTRIANGDDEPPALEAS
jgi:hypothetical protein